LPQCPAFAGVVDKDDMENLREEIQRRCPKYDFSVKAVKKRKLFLRRVDEQLLTNEQRRKRWERQKQDFTAVSKYDDAILKLHDEQKFQTSLASCGALGDIPQTRKRHRSDYDPEPTRRRCAPSEVTTEVMDNRSEASESSTVTINKRLADFHCDDEVD
jgi:hypothetical protein